MESTATSKGQIVILFSIRKKLGITTGTKLHIEMDEKANRIILQPITRKYIHGFRGKFKGKGLLKALMAGKKREREL